MLVCEVSNLEEGFMLREDITTRATPWVDESTQLQHTRWDRVLIRKKNVIFFHFVSMCLYEMVDVEQIYCDNHFMIFVSQIIMLYTHTLLYVNYILVKLEEKKKLQPSFCPRVSPRLNYL